MGRPVKLTDRNKEWFRRRTPCCERRLNTRVERQRFLIVCEGEKTEPNYFKSLKEELPLHLVQLEIFGKGASTLSLIEEAETIRKRPEFDDYPFDQVWAVFDRDSFASEDFDNAIYKAESCGMHCAWSNESFELWYILHFEFRDTEMSRTEYKDKLGALAGEPYRKNAPDMYQKLLRIGNETQAAEWAKTLYDDFRARGVPPSRCNPCTTVFLLVNELNSFKNTL